MVTLAPATNFDHFWHTVLSNHISATFNLFLISLLIVRLSEPYLKVGGPSRLNTMFVMELLKSSP